MSTKKSHGKLNGAVHGPQPDLVIARTNDMLVRLSFKPGTSWVALDPGTAIHAAHGILESAVEAGAAEPTWYKRETPPPLTLWGDAKIIRGEAWNTQINNAVVEAINSRIKKAWTLGELMHPPTADDLPRLIVQTQGAIQVVLLDGNPILQFSPVQFSENNGRVIGAIVYRQANADGHPQLTGHGDIHVETDRGPRSEPDERSVATGGDG